MLRFVLLALLVSCTDDPAWFCSSEGCWRRRAECIPGAIGCAAQERAFCLRNVPDRAKACYRTGAQCMTVVRSLEELGGPGSMGESPCVAER